MNENKIFSNDHQVRKIKINAQGWTNCTRWFYNLDKTIIPPEQKKHNTFLIQNMGTFVCVWLCVRLCVCVEYTKPICTTSVQRLDVGPTLYTCYSNVFCLQIEIASEFAFSRQESLVSLWDLILKCSAVRPSGARRLDLLLSSAPLRLYSSQSKNRWGVTVTTVILHSSRITPDVKGCISPTVELRDQVALAFWKVSILTDL